MTDALRRKLDKVLLRFARSTLDPKAPHMGGVASRTMEQIEQAFHEAGYISPESAKQVQQLVNQMADNAQAMAKLPVTVREAGTMTGQKWYDRFENRAPRQLTEADKLDFTLHDDDPAGNRYYAYNCALDEARVAARFAAGLE